MASVTVLENLLNFGREDGSVHAFYFLGRRSICTCLRYFYKFLFPLSNKKFLASFLDDTLDVNVGIIH